MTCYAETSAVLSWLLGEPAAPEVLQILDTAATVVASQLTVAECGRALARMVPAEQASRRLKLDSEISTWVIVPVSPRILTAVQNRFPVEPIRTLDAIHVATALEIRADFPGLAMLSLDHRVRDNATAYGLQTYPR